MTLIYHWLRTIVRLKAGHVIVPTDIINLSERSVILTRYVYSTVVVDSLGPMNV